jgi:hypothetical protein
MEITKQMRIEFGCMEMTEEQRNEFRNGMDELLLKLDRLLSVKK